VSLESQLKRIAEELEPEVREALHNGAEQIAEAARVRVPVDTGHLREAIHVTVEREGFHVVAGDKEAFYGHMVEHGTTHSPPHPFLVPAFEENKERLVESVNEAIRKLT
jgi:HK97 gp10 family phage protein